MKRGKAKQVASRYLNPKQGPSEKLAKGKLDTHNLRNRNQSPESRPKIKNLKQELQEVDNLHTLML